MLTKTSLALSDRQRIQHALHRSRCHRQDAERREHSAPQRLLAAAPSPSHQRRQERGRSLDPPRPSRRSQDLHSAHRGQTSHPAASGRRHRHAPSRPHLEHGPAALLSDDAQPDRRRTRPVSSPRNSPRRFRKFIACSQGTVGDALALQRRLLQQPGQRRRGAGSLRNPGHASSSRPRTPEHPFRTKCSAKCFRSRVCPSPAAMTLTK